MNFYLYIKKRIAKITKIATGLMALAVGYCAVASSDYVKVIDGDSLEIGSRRVRLLHIDAPEYKQYCFTADKKKYDCGREAQAYLYQMLKQEHFNMKCETRDVDRYQRELSECFINDKNLNLAMLSAGWAVTYRTDDKEYLRAERTAQKQKIGVWQGKFMRPEYYRRLQREKNRENWRK